MSLALICVAAGSGRRFGGDKLSQTIGTRTVLECSVTALCRAYPRTPLILVVAPQRLSSFRTLLSKSYPNAELIPGGERRQDSVRLGVERAHELGASVVAVHDAARPLVHMDDVRKVVESLDDGDGAILCQPVADTVKRVDSSGAILETVERESLRLAATPQVFRVAALQQAWSKTSDDAEWTDEAALLEKSGLTVRCIVGDHPNPKLTTPADLDLLRALEGVNS